MKVREIVFLDDAVEDILLGRQFYDEQEEGVGDYFFDSIISDSESLRLYAGIHRKQHGYFRLLSVRFPFAIYYDIHVAIVRIIAVLDMRKNPDSIRKSLDVRKTRPTNGGNIE